ncbi:putative 26S proteasome non-ATPase regulatory subunit 3 [Psilocybe cubensis]|uniref:26S proteasome non-ATPase regulatory subunit 3 n=1 Tax=Psilocybe cubensis TaxID=181762 RepID=A0ACB8GS46_PSICU|nr:putative 26S proteasome non-ATPase regulatory subunit 3 [Psilocybe cubensis]KAH9478555.1 putative 26S proteasome non-ATPase regulatory subunit 3 [Psilocybe cubensis]
MPDVEMKPAESKQVEEEKPQEERKPVPVHPLAEIKSNVALIDRAVTTLEPRFTHRVLRTLTALRKRIDASILRNAVESIYSKGWIPAASDSEDQSMDVDAPSKPSLTDVVPEVEMYLRLLILYQLLKDEDNHATALDLANETVKKMQDLNRRSMDAIAAKVWMAVDRAYSANDLLPEARPLFLAAQRTASLRNDDEANAVLLNCLLNNYLSFDQPFPAQQLVSKATFPPSASNGQLARYHFYLGRIRAIQLNYTDAHTNLQQAIRRAPPAKTAPGFYQAIHKFFVIVELLMGDIPDRSIFRHEVLKKPLNAYFETVKAVRSGSLARFEETFNKHIYQFKEDNVFKLVLRLRQNVIKTGLRRLSLSYSRISLKDICVKLNLDSEENAEYVVTKAIRDGVIEGKMVHEQGWMECGSQKNGYGPEVSEVFGRRIAFCLDLHNQSVKAMRYPLNAHRKELAAAEGAREREKELAKEIQDGDLDDEDLGPEF